MRRIKHETWYSRNVNICLEHVLHLALKTLQSADPDEESVCYHNVMTYIDLGSHLLATLVHFRQKSVKKHHKSFNYGQVLARNWRKWSG
jgi:hypothetical protein